MGRQMTSIRLKFVHRYVDRTGKLRHYVRRKGARPVALPGLPGSREFMSAYQAALADMPQPISRHKPGTLADLITAYYRAGEFQNLKPYSQVQYRRILERHAKRDGHRLVRDMPHDKASKIIEEIGETKPAMANLTRSVLLRLFKYAIRMRLRTDNPFLEVPIYKIGTRHTWTDVELGAYEKKWPFGTRERLAYAVLLYTGQRVSDAVKFRRPGPRDSAFTLIQQKTGTSDHDEITIPIHPELWRAIKAGPANGLNLIADARGRPVNEDTLSKLIRRAADDAGLPKACKAHGLRKALMARLANSGATTKEIAAVSGHKSLKEVERYTAKADQRRLAKQGMEKL